MQPWRLGFWHLLPIVESLLYVILWTTGLVIDTQRSAVPPQSPIRPRLIYTQETGAIEWKPQKPPSFSLPTEVAISLNLPSFIAAALLCSALHRESLMSLFWTSGLLGLPLWYAMGRWVAREISWLPHPRRYHRIGSVLLWVLAPISVTALVLSIYRVATNLHSTEVWVGYAFVGWSLFFVVVTVVSLKRRQATARQAG